MIYIRQKEDLGKYLKMKRKGSKTIGFVPTMGALHDGHLSLIQRSKNETDITVCSIFVNPTQFNDPSDFRKYPVTPDKDIQLLAMHGTDVVFHPPVLNLYPGGTEKLETYNLGNLEHILEGKYRPGHFQGVCQVMKRLLDSVMPDKLYMGEKDFQQCLVVQKLLDIIHSDVILIRSKTVREPEGLAMSSRNLRLSEENKRNAVIISKALSHVKEYVSKGNLTELRNKATELISEKGLKVDYLEIVDSESLEIISDWDGKRSLVVLVAAFAGDVRLIDNMVLNGQQ